MARRFRNFRNAESMTLKEYLKQKDPVRHPTVYLKPKEYKIAETHKSVMGEVRSRVYINTNHHLLAGVEYCLIGTMLYTTDIDGNAKNSGVFRIVK
jgi:hypothetical protein